MDIIGSFLNPEQLQFLITSIGAETTIGIIVLALYHRIVTKRISEMRIDQEKRIREIKKENDHMKEELKHTIATIKKMNEDCVQERKELQNVLIRISKVE